MTTAYFPGPRRVILQLALSVWLAAFAAAPASAQSVAGTPYDALDLTSPEAALRTFLTAYRQGDFVTAFWVLSPHAQEEWYKLWSAYVLEQMVRGPLSELRIADFVRPPEKREQQGISFIFADVMTVAQRLGRLPLDLDGSPADVSATRVPTLGIRRDIPDGRVEIAIALKAYPAPVIFRLERSPLGKWRVRQAIPPGGDESAIPWGRRREL